MRLSKWKSPRTTAAVLLAASCASLAGLLVPSTASADPAYESPTGLVAGVGSDTIQDVFGGYTGANNAKTYAAMHSDSPSGGVQVASFDAIPLGGSTAAPGCITSKLGGPAFDRPDGSGNGRAALLASQSAATPWQNPTVSKRCTAAAVNVSGQIDFARSSSLGGSAGTTLTYIPFGRDALSYAFFDHSGSNPQVYALTTAQLKSLYTSGTGFITTANGRKVWACMVQSGSGTRSSFLADIGETESTVAATLAATPCPQSEEHGGNAFYTWASTLPAAEDAIIPFSVSQWVCQWNGPCVDRSATARTNGVDMGDVDNIAPGGKPYTGVSPNAAADPTYFANGTWGRDMWVVVLTARIGNGPAGSAALKSLFKGGTSAICASDAQTTRALFGFAPSTLACGDFTTTRNN
jgi:hypothetical protein